MNNRTRHSTISDKLIVLLSTGCYFGFSPIIPGTTGSLFGAIIFWLLPSMVPSIYMFGLVVSFFAGVYISTHAERIFGRDGKPIVIDEVVGMFITMWLVPKSIEWLIYGFILFRGFDVIKPFPAHRLQRVSSGWGVMLDDVIAGIYANLSVHLFGLIL